MYTRFMGRFIYLAALQAAAANDVSGKQITDATLKAAQEHAAASILNQIDAEDTCAQNGSYVTLLQTYASRLRPQASDHPQPVALFQQSSETNEHPRPAAANPWISLQHTPAFNVEVGVIAGVLRTGYGLYHRGSSIRAGLAVTLPEPDVGRGHDGHAASEILLIVTFLTLVLMTTFAFYKVLCARLEPGRGSTTKATNIAEEPECCVDDEFDNELDERDVQDKQPKGSAMFECVTAIPLQNGKDIKDMISLSSGYDCAVQRPWSSGKPVRFAARVSLKGSSPLQAPLTRRECVLYSAGASRRLHDGMHPVSVAYSSLCLDFDVTVLDAPDISVSVGGSDVLLFDQHSGLHSVTETYNDAPNHCQVFATSHRASAIDEGSSWTPLDCAIASQHLALDSPLLEFQESALLVGAAVTLVGELHRSAEGQLSLQPWKQRADHEPWRTSWERCDSPCEFEIGKTGQSSDASGLPTGKVFVSDSPSLILHGRVAKEAEQDRFSRWFRK